ncbi:hypothetical protein EGW08_020026, partial [Elysia chlorotica]
MSGCPIKHAMAEDLMRARAENGGKGVPKAGDLMLGQNSGRQTIPGVNLPVTPNGTGLGGLNHGSNSDNTISTTPHSDSSDTSPSSPSTSPLKTLNPSGELTPIRKISPSSSNPPILNTAGRKVSPPNPNHVTFYTVIGDSDRDGSSGTPSSGSKQIHLDETGSEPSNYGSGEGSPRLRKTSNISTTSSLGSEGDFSSENGGEKRVDVNTLIEAVGTLIIPADYYARRAMQNLINMKNPRALELLRNESSELFAEELLQRSYSDQSLRHDAISDATLVSMATESGKKLGVSTQQILRMLGQEYFKVCLGDYGKALRMLGSNLLEFFSNIDGLQEQVSAHHRFHGQTPPSFRCDWEKGQLNLHYYSLRRAILYFVAGTVEAVSSLLFTVDLSLTVSPNKDETAPHHLFFISTATTDNNNENHHNARTVEEICPREGRVSNRPQDSKIGVKTFCASFPFHVVFDQDLNISQLGQSLAKFIAPEVASRGKKFETYFEVVRPVVKYTFSSILSRVNSSFVIRTRSGSTENHRLSDVSSYTHGEAVEPMTVENVTMLFSDIVGFTAICSTATPLQVVDMLNSLYTHFDQYCVDIDVYKIETIGDAYCVAGGLHRVSQYHAQQIAWMALKMMAAATNETSHDGAVIKMRIGIHTGRVLAGVVGRRMPRYCLFGNNVSIANKFESGSEP